MESFQIGFFSLSHTHSRFLRVSSWLESSFIFGTEYYSIVHPSPTEGWSGFQILTIINKAAVNIEVR